MMVAGSKDFLKRYGDEVSKNLPFYEVHYLKIEQLSLFDCMKNEKHVPVSSIVKQIS